MTFTELKTDVYEIAQAKFGQLEPEVVQRLDVGGGGGIFNFDGGLNTSF